jgi:L-iditol 2-dehydrogenase
VARARGLRVVAVSEPNARRGAVAQRLGAERVLDPRSEDAVAAIRDLTGGLGVDLAIDAVGREDTRRAAAASVTRGGTALLLGLETGNTTLDFLDLIRREVRLQTSFTYTDGDYATALEMVARGAADFTPWTDLLPLAEGQRAFERLVTDPQDRVKIALQP